MNFYLDTIDWVAIGAIASFVMVIVTYVTLRQNKMQLNELRRQWEEQNRPEIVFKIKVVKSIVRLEISNIGNSVASNIEFYFNEEFLKVLKEDCTSYWKTENVIKQNPIEQFPLDLVKGQAKSYPLFIRIEGMSDSILKTMINIRGRYNGKYDDR